MNISIHNIEHLTSLSLSLLPFSHFHSLSFTPLLLPPNLLISILFSLVFSHIHLLSFSFSFFSPHRLSQFFSFYFLTFVSCLTRFSSLLTSILFLTLYFFPFLLPLLCFHQQSQVLSENIVSVGSTGENNNNTNMNNNSDNNNNSCYNSCNDNNFPVLEESRLRVILMGQEYSNNQVYTIILKLLLF